MKIENLRTDFNKAVKRYTWAKFRDTFSKNKAVMHDLHMHGHTLETAFTSITGKQVPSSAKKSEQQTEKKEDKKNVQKSD